MQELTEKIKAAGKAGSAFMQLMLKLETDGHMRAAGTERPVVVLLPEMIAYVTARFEPEGPEEEFLIRGLVKILPPEEERTINGICAGIRSASEDFRSKPEEIPGTYLALCRFDAMAQEYDGAFYSRMNVENPGRLAEYYLNLLDAVYEIATELAGAEASEWETCRRRFVESY